MHVGMKLAACGTLRNDSVGEFNVVDYLLFALNRMGRFTYVDHMKIGEHGPQEHSKIMLAKSALSLGWIDNVKDIQNGGYMKRPNYERAAERFLKGFREGHFGPIVLDTDEFL